MPGFMESMGGGYETGVVDGVSVKSLMGNVVDGARCPCIDILGEGIGNGDGFRKVIE